MKEEISMRYLTAAVTISALASYASTPTRGAESESIARGKVFAEANCTSCHALTDDKPQRADVPSLARAADRFPAAMLAESLEAGIQVGHPKMPVFVFERENVADLVAYMETLRSER
ncbi:c-type cytochrome [Pacificimonas sp. ICDLI1SI03]